jgi:hypothetical protein
MSGHVYAVAADLGHAKAPGSVAGRVEEDPVAGLGGAVMKALAPVG